MVTIAVAAVAAGCAGRGPDAGETRRRIIGAEAAHAGTPEISRLPRGSVAGSEGADEPAPGRVRPGGVKSEGQEDPFKRRKILEAVRAACRHAKRDDVAIPGRVLPAVIERLRASDRRIRKSVTGDRRRQGGDEGAG